MKIAIASGKGGTGKTTLSTNLASFLAEKFKVVLSDLDVEEPNSGLFIHGDLIYQEDKYKMIPEWVQSKCDLCGICREVCNFNAITQILDEILVFPELCHGCYACSELCPQDALPMKKKKMGVLKHYEKGNLSFIESKLDIGEEQAVPLIAQTIDYIDKFFSKDIIKLYDAPPGTSCPVIEASKTADFIILVTEPTPFGLHDLKLAVETVRELKKDFAIVINRYGIGDNKVEKYCAEEDIPLIAKIPNKRKIAELYSNGNLLYSVIPEVKNELEKIINYLFDNYKENFKNIADVKNGGAA
jgi:MinD superfamily P-loop ATPase